MISNNPEARGCEVEASAFPLLGTNKGFPLSLRCIMHVFRIGRALSTLYIDQRHMTAAGHAVHHCCVTVRNVCAVFPLRIMITNRSYNSHNKHQLELQRGKVRLQKVEKQKAVIFNISSMRVNLRSCWPLLLPVCVYVCDGPVAED